MFIFPEYLLRLYLVSLISAPRLQVAVVSILYVLIGITQLLLYGVVLPVLIAAVLRGWYAWASAAYYVSVLQCCILL